MHHHYHHCDNTCQHFMSLERRYLLPSFSSDTEIQREHILHKMLPSYCNLTLTGAFNFVFASVKVLRSNRSHRPKAS